MSGRPSDSADRGASVPRGRNAEFAGSGEWAGRLRQQADACEQLGSQLWGRVLRIVADDVAAEGPSWSVLGERAGLRFGQAGPLRLVGASHRLALTGHADDWASLLPSCGGAVPAPGDRGDAVLRDRWLSLVERRGDELVAGLDREVQTNEVGRAAALGYAHAVVLASHLAHFGVAVSALRLVELGCSGGLNLRSDRFRLDLGGAPSGGLVLGDPEGRVRLRPDVRTAIVDQVLEGTAVERIGIDPHPIDPTSDEGRVTLLSFVWPDQTERFDRLVAAIDVARQVPARLVATGSRTTAAVLDDELEQPAEAGVATVVQHSIVWQYVPVDERPAIAAVIERRGRDATPDSPLVWVRYEPDEWDRTRAAVWVRCWPAGGDRLVAHADYHGRWLAPVPAGC